MNIVQQIGANWAVVTIFMIGIVLGAIIGAAAMDPQTKTRTNFRSEQEQQRIGTVMKIAQGDIDCFIYYGSNNQAMSCLKVR